MRPNLTMNLGVRYEIETGWRDAKGNQTTFDPAVQNFNVQLHRNALNGISTRRSAHQLRAACGTSFRDKTAAPRCRRPSTTSLLPRFGFSWQILPETVIRGGIGMFASTWSEDTYGGGEGNAFGSSGGYGDNTNGICPVVQTSAAL